MVSVRFSNKKVTVDFGRDSVHAVVDPEARLSGSRSNWGLRSLAKC